MPDSILLPKPKDISKFSTTSILTWTALVIYLVWQIRFLYKKGNLYIKSWNFPGPLNLPIIGVAYLFLFKKSDEFYDVVVELQQKYKDGFKVWFGPRLIYFLSKPPHIEKVLTKSLEKDVLYKHIIDVVGDGLMTARVPQWKRHRKAIMPAFHQKILDSFVEIFANKSLTFAQALEKNCGKELDIFHMTSRCTLDIILETAMGVKINLQNGDHDSDYGIVLDRIMEITCIKIFAFYYHIDFIWKLSPMGRELEKLKARLNSLIDKIIEEKLRAKSRRRSSLVAQVEDSKSQKIFLDLIIDTTDFTPKELRDEVCIFIFAGTDTTAATMSFLFTVLGIHQDVQQKVYEEILEILGPDRLPQPSDLPLMKYTEKVIKETLRLFPVGAFFLRTITEDLDLGDMTLPKGASVFFGTQHLHRNPQVWEDPLKFDPERFSPENIQKIEAGAYIPFSLGARNCIGQKYGMMSMKVVLANVLRRVKFLSHFKHVSEVETKTNIVLRYKNKTNLYVEKRNE